MFLPPHFTRQAHQLFIEQVPLKNIIAQFGTPTYVYSANALRDTYQAYEAACIRADGTRRASIHYAMKANGNLAVLQLFARLGAGFDIVSGGDLLRVIAAGGDPKKVVFSGVGKSVAEMRLALEHGVMCFNVESIPELYRLNEVAQEMGVTAPISLRINPNVDAKTHPYISTGLKGNKFGVAYDEVLDTYHAAAKMAHLKIVGIDCHIGSQITEISPYLDAIDRVLEMVEALEKEGIVLQHVDLGGGLGITYVDETPPQITAFTNTLLEHLEKRGHGHRHILFEPGRSLVGNAGVLLTQVEYLKPGETKNFCIVDAAMNDLARPAMYEAYQTITPILERVGKAVIYDVVGPVCESGDWLGRDRELCVEAGDGLAILSAGAYGFSMSSNYNTRPRAAEVMVDGDKLSCIRARETYAQLMQGEHLLP